MAKVSLAIALAAASCVSATIETTDTNAVAVADESARQLDTDPWSDDGHSTAWSAPAEDDDYYYGGKGGKSGSYGGKGGKSGGYDDDGGWGTGGQYHGHWIYLPNISPGKSGKTKGGKSGSYDDDGEFAVWLSLSPATYVTYDSSFRDQFYTDGGWMRPWGPGPCRCPPSGPSGKSGKTKGRNLEGEDQDRELWGAPGCSCGDDDWAPPGWGSDDDYYYGGKGGKSGSKGGQGGKSGSKGGKSGGYDDDYSPWSPPGWGPWGPAPPAWGSDDDYYGGKGGKSGSKGGKSGGYDDDYSPWSPPGWGPYPCDCGDDDYSYGKSGKTRVG
ncbi:hypothetical protein THAOC_20532, partial [Thalassiosira oceanica]